MGLLDREDSVDYFAFPDFDSSFSPPQTPSSSPEEKSAASPAQSTAASSSRPKPLRSRTSSILSPTLNSLGQSNKSRRRSTLSKPPRPLPGKCFDLYGEDEELQSAEPTIKFCDRCFKHCDIH